jgi:hypothetical protein
MQTSAAGNFQPTESLFAVYREPFFNTIDPKRSWNRLAAEMTIARVDLSTDSGSISPGR